MPSNSYVVLPIEKRRQYEEKAVYFSPHSLVLNDLMRYTIEHGIGRDDRFWPMVIGPMAGASDQAPSHALGSMTSFLSTGVGSSNSHVVTIVNDQLTDAERVAPWPTLQASLFADLSSSMSSSSFSGF